MPKTIKEFIQDYSGNVTIEYSDGTTRAYSADDVPTVSTNPVTEMLELTANGEVILVPELTPSGGDDGPAIIAMATANNGVVRLSKGRFRIETYTELHVEGLGLTGLTIMGAGEGITFVDVPESFPSSLGTPFANWLDARPALRIFTTSNNVTAITLGGL